MSGNPHDPDLTPILPHAASPDARGGGAAPSRPRPKVEPADPARWSRSVTLAFPVTVDGELLTALTIRRLTTRDVADLLIEDDDETSLNLRARALACGVHPIVLEELAADDGETVAVAARPFLPAALVAIEEDLRAELASGTMT